MFATFFRQKKNMQKKTSKFHCESFDMAHWVFSKRFLSVNFPHHRFILKGKSSVFQNNFNNTYVNFCNDIFLSYFETWDFYPSILSTAGFKTLSVHLEVRKTPKRHPKNTQKTSKDLPVSLFKCYVLDFVVGTWAIDTCVLDFVGLGISETMSGKKTVWKKPFSHGFFPCFFGQKIVKNKMQI